MTFCYNHHINEIGHIESRYAIVSAHGKPLTLFYAQLHYQIPMLINHILLEHYTRWIDLLCSVAASKIIDIVAVELTTTDGEHVDSLAVDGNADPRGLCSRTEWQVEPSLRLQLGSIYIIRSVTIFTPECCRRFITN